MEVKAPGSIQVRVYTEDPKLHAELVIHLSSKNKQKVLALVDSRLECTLLYGNLNHFQSPSLPIDGYGESTIRAKKIPLVLQIG